MCQQVLVLPHSTHNFHYNDGSNLVEQIWFLNFHESILVEARVNFLLFYYNNGSMFFLNS